MRMGKTIRGTLGRLKQGFFGEPLKLHDAGDDYSENLINDPNEVIKLFSYSDLVKSRRIKNSFDTMNFEVVMRKR